MKLFTLLLTLFASHQVFAAKGLEHCLDAINRHHPNAALNKLWTLDDSGKIHLEDSRKGLSDNVMITFTKEKNVITVNDRYLNGETVLTTIELKNGVISKITSDRRGNNSGISTNRTSYRMEGSVCVPEQLESREFAQADKKIVPKLCNELRNYISKNPKAVSCDCGDKASNKALADIMGNYGIKADDIERQTKTLFTPTTTRNSYREKEPLYTAVNMISDCNSAFPGLMRDSKYWNPGQQIPFVPELKPEAAAIKE